MNRAAPITRHDCGADDDPADHRASDHGASGHRAADDSASGNTPACDGPADGAAAPCGSGTSALGAERQLPELQRGLGGRRLSAYDGYSTDEPAELDVDHVVALAEAWRSGASSWPTARRTAFANDLDDQSSLIAVTAATNRSTGDSDPASWQPANRADWCAFATAWTTVKVRWALTADTAEVTSLRNMLVGC